MALSKEQIEAFTLACQALPETELFLFSESVHEAGGGTELASYLQRERHHKEILNALVDGFHEVAAAIWKDDSDG